VLALVMPAYPSRAPPLVAALFPVQDSPDVLAGRMTRSRRMGPSLTMPAAVRTGEVQSRGKDRKVTDVDRPGGKMVVTQRDAFF
jgi:hypothetical protein